MSGVSKAIVQPLLDWYDAGHRDLPWRSEPAPYRVWVSEIMLQQTRVEAVRGYFSRWMNALPDIPALAAADEAVYTKLWEGLGYYSRVRNLHRAAVLLCEEYGGELPADYDELRSARRRRVHGRRGGVYRVRTARSGGGRQCSACGGAAG
ncbi:MAG: hypothetical protein ACLT4C_05500 [Butyricicoccus sp.]